ncbi:ABC transporter substrate-binding protein [Fluviispira multicolorata]|uniref:Solute-binding protein family 5 domain-containing protein n=1 Tax=Fluviispira multicolorata TaxID=2654512 RepID=A0A833JGI9_9BACT|nr:ABC transporter substrate-binding protein [Fluviispira multicolorata]KAB8032101.1 hypothetical protein GCL57_05495 [Fluviispira multicolorata]
MFIKYKMIFIVIFLIFPLSSLSQSHYRKNLNMINVAVSAFPETLDPVKVWNYQHYLLVQCAFQTLIRFDESGSIVGDLAEKWEISSDKKIYTFYLNRNTKFHNGHLVTADDVAWSMSRHFWPKSESITGSYLEKVLSNSKLLQYGEIHPSINVINDYTIQFHLKSAYPALIYILSMPAFSILQKSNISTKIPIGSGPLKAEYSSDSESLIFKRYENYSNIKPSIKKISVFKLKYTVEENELLKNNNIDIIIGFPRGEIENVVLPVEYELKKMSGLIYTHLFFNLSKNRFKNKNARKYISNAIQKSFNSSSDFSKFYSYNPYYFPKGVMPIEYYKKSVNSDYVFSSKKLDLLENIKILVQKGNINNKMFQIFEDTFLKLGVKVKWNFVDLNFIDEIKKNQYDLLIAGYVGNFPDPDGYLDPLKSNSIINFGNIPTDSLFKELEKYRFISEPVERLQKYSDSFKRFENEFYFIPLFQASLPIIKKKNIVIPEEKFRYEGELWKIFWK